MAQRSGYIIESIAQIGEAEGGQYAQITLKPKGGEAFTIFIPMPGFSDFVRHTLAAGALAHTEQVKTFRDPEKAAQAIGISPFEPNGFSIGRIQLSPATEPHMLIRLSKNNFPALDVAMAPANAVTMAQAILEQAQKSSSPKIPTH